MEYGIDPGLTPVFWLTLALINAGLAQSKNRSRWRWFVVSLFVGPLATALIVVWPRGRHDLETLDFHPVQRVADRFLLLSTVGLIVAALGVIGCLVSVGVVPAFPLFVGVIVVGAIAVVVGSRGYVRRTRSTP